MKREDLKALGLQQDIIDKIMDLHQVDAQEYQATKANATELQTKLTEATTTIDQLTTQASQALSLEEVNTKLAEQKQEYEKRIADYERKVEVDKYFQNIKFTSDLARQATIEAFNKKDFKLENGKFLGADDFLNELKQNNPNAFESEQQNIVKTNDIGAENTPTISTFKTFF